MRRTLRKIVNVLDGQPTGVRGQSLIELAITAPLLILMVFSLVEVGLVANDYLILMDVVRGAGRDAVNLDPTKWSDADTRNQQRLDCDTITDTTIDPVAAPKTVEDARFLLRENSAGTADHRALPRAQGLPGFGSTENLWGYHVGHDSTAYGFFDEVACQVTKSMSPMVFNDYSATSPYPYGSNPDPANPDARDDIVVSAISYSVIDYSGLPAGQQGPYYSTGPGSHGNFWVTVTGRWPLANRYCAEVVGGAVVSGDSRDPFDWKRNDYNLAWHNGHNDSGTDYDTDEWAPPYYVYNSGTGNMDARPTNKPPVDSGQTTGILDASASPADSQGIRGFIFTGTHVNDDGCYGSRFTVQDIETRMNLDSDWNPKMKSANGGLVIVEVFWQYHPLVLGPIFEGFTGSKVNDPILWVWGWFPAPDAESTATPVS
jgi:hypothetical protein